MRKFGVKDFDNYWEDRAIKGRDHVRRVHLFLFNLLLEKVKKGGRILDCGVGDGQLFRMCEKRFDVYGVEMSQEAIDSYKLPKDKVLRSDLNKGIPDFGEGFDAIVASKVLHWLDNPGGFLLDVKDNLNPDGIFILVIPNITFYRYRLQLLFGKFPKISLSHRNFQVPREAEEMFREGGFKIVKRLTTKTSLKARLCPLLFGLDLVYVLSKI